MCLSHQLAKLKIMAYGNYFLPKTLFFAQNVAQLRNFVSNFASITVSVNLLCLLYFSEYKYTTNFRETVILSEISKGGKLS